MAWTITRDLKFINMNMLNTNNSLQWNTDENILQWITDENVLHGFELFIY